MNIFRGYFKSNGKQSFYSPKRDTLLPKPPNDSDYVGILNPDIVQVDIDDYDDAQLIWAIVKAEKINCDVLKTKRGLHFYFINDPRVKTQHQHFCTTCGIEADYGLGEKNRPVPLRISETEKVTYYENGEEYEKVVNKVIIRDWLQQCEELDKIPEWLMPLGKQAENLRNTDTRNQTLYNYILTLQAHNFNKEEIRNIIRIVNKYIFKNPLDDNEIESITRDDAFREDLFFTEKDKFMHDIFGNYMLNNCDIVNINGQINIYTKNKVYSNDPIEFEKIMIDKIPTLKETQRKEVYKYITLKCDKYAEFSDPKYIGLKDEILDLESMTTMPYNPQFIIQNKIPYNYNPLAYSEIMDRTLDKVSCHDKEIRSLIEEMIGYSLYRKNSMQVCFILTGEGSNGKSTILNCIKKLLGKSNYTSLDLRELEDTFKPSELYNKLANIGDDISAKYLDNSSVFKKCVTGESFMVQRKYGTPFELESYATQIFCANEIPQSSDRTEGFSRRIVVVPFKASFKSTDSDYDPFIESKLLSDESIEYLLKIALDGLRRVLIRKTFTKSKVGELEKQEYIKSNNNVLEWLETEPKIENEAVGEVYSEYQTWCVMNGCMALKKSNFSKELSKKGYNTKPIRFNGKVIRVYTNV